MKAIRIREPGGPEVLELCEVAAVRPGLGEIVVRVAASGLNRADLLQRMGRYPAPAGAPADIPGLEYSGVVEAVGRGVSAWVPGDRVMGIVGGGGYAELTVTHERTAVRVPVGLDTVSAGAVPEVFMTAYDALFRQAGLSAGETVLIHAVGSGVGTAAVQLARRAGARTLGTSRTPDKLARAAELGLDAAIPGDEAWPERVRELTGGRGVDVILDLVGGPYLPGNLSVMATLARQVVVGVPGGSVSEIDLRALMGRRASIRGTVVRARPLEEKAALARQFESRVVPGLEDGSLRPVVHETFRPEDVGKAHGAMERNENFGKLLIVWP
jgi:putative PIG3 family NAD(P)H quinone oxidoreductase